MNTVSLLVGGFFYVLALSVGALTSDQNILIDLCAFVACYSAPGPALSGVLQVCNKHQLLAG